MKYNVGKNKNRDVYIDECIDLVDHLTKNWYYVKKKDS